MQVRNLFVAAVILLTACKTNRSPQTSSISYSRIEKDIMALSADSMLGRAPFTIGETRAVTYIEERMKGIGLEPVFGKNFFQEVPMVSITTNLPEKVDVSLASGKISFKVDDDICLWSPTSQAKVDILNAPLLFLGFGINAPEYSWNDYEGVDVKGKVIVVLVNDPGYYLHDSTLFTGYAMTYYGRWRYKFEEAERHGALGCIIVHEDGPAGYPWSVAGSKSNSPILYIDSKSLDSPSCKLNGWLTHSAATSLFKRCGYSYEVLKMKATQRGFKPINLNASISLNMQNSVEHSVSRNVAGYIKGTQKPQEFIVYTAHWDHLGVGRPVNGDSIYNGASDNAAAIAWMLSIAKAFKQANSQPLRSIVFLSPTAEESGLFGSEYFVKNCPFDISKAIACLNYDVVLFLGRFKDVTVTGYGHSNLDNLLQVVAQEHNRYVTLDPNPENGMFYRSDQLPFLKAGVPAIFAKGYTHHAELGREKTLELIKSYWQNVYHKPGDEYDPKRDRLDGLVDDAELFYEVGYRLANQNIYPKWRATSEFYR